MPTELLFGTEAATVGGAVFDRGRGTEMAEMGDSAFDSDTTIDLPLFGVE